MNTLTGIVIWLLLVAAYWAPSITAWRRDVPGRGQVIVVNLFLGWTVVGWIVALTMAFREVPAAPPRPGAA